jgi:hypothetical protein
VKECGRDEIDLNAQKERRDETMVGKNSASGFGEADCWELIVLA